MAIIKTNYLKHEDDYYEIIPPIPTESERGGVVASSKSSTDTVEAKLGDNGKLYVSEYPDLDSHNTSSSAHSDIRDEINELKNQSYTLPDATTTQKGGVIIGDNVQVSNGTISVKDASISQKGVVQLTDDIDSTSTSTAATPNSVKKAYDLADSAKTTADAALTEAKDIIEVHTGNADVHVTTTNKTQWNSAYTHSQSAHAPSTAEKNVIVGIQKNGTDITPNSSTRKVNITVPTKASDVGADPSGSADSALASAKAYADSVGETAQTNLDEHIDDSTPHISAAERTKLSGIEAGAQKNVLTGVKGNAETTYRTGNVNITPANIGLGNVNNTSDASKPVSTAQQAAIDSALEEANEYTNTEVAKKADSGHNHDTKYDAKGAADTALASSKTYTDTKTSGLASTTVVDNKVSAHNTSTSAHSDIRSLITNLTNRLNALANSTDEDLDQMAEIVAYIKANKSLIDSITTSKVNVSDIVDNLTTSSASKVLSAKQGVVLKALIDGLQSALDTLEGEFDGHGHVIADISGLQTALDNKAAFSHGTHVSYSTTAPVMDGTASVGSASTVARSDHKHPTDTSRASQVDLDALEAIVDGKANNAHSHAIPDIANLQTILDAKQSIITGGASTITSSNLTANRALVSNGSGKVAVSAVTSTELGYLDGAISNIQTQLDGKSASGHTHSYAGSASAGGSANSAVKLDSSAGSATQPVYFKDGKPTAISYTVSKSVPSNAVFTDTHYASKNVVGSSTATSNTTSALTNGNVYLNSVENGAVTSAHKISGSGATTVTTDTSGNIVVSSTNTTYGAAGSSLGLVKTGGDVTISSGVITVNDDSHNHTIANVDNLQATLDSKVPSSRTVNGKALTANITLSASDVSAYSKTEIDNYVFITVDDIDTICGASIQMASEVTF